MEFKKVKDSEVFLSVLMQPSHSNFGGKIHGGYILSLMDQIAFACASKHSGAYSAADYECVRLCVLLDRLVVWVGEVHPGNRPVVLLPVPGHSHS